MVQIRSTFGGQRTRTLVGFLSVRITFTFKVLHHRSRKNYILQYYDQKFDFNKCIGQPKDHIDHQKNRIGYAAGGTAPSTKIF